MRKENKKNQRRNNKRKSSNKEQKESDSTNEFKYEITNEMEIDPVSIRMIGYKTFGSNELRYNLKPLNRYE